MLYLIKEMIQHEGVLFMLIYLCDDSTSDLLRLEHYLVSYAEQNRLDFELKSFFSGEELTAAYRQASVKPELVFLDIFMSGLTGMDAARQLRSMHYEGGIIFTTSSTEHAMDSYEVNALYYLQKPYDRIHFINAMERCSTLREKAKPRFTFIMKKREIAVLPEDILFFETGQAHFIILHTVSQTYTFQSTLKQIIDFFENNDSYIAIGRSYLVNLKHVTGQTENDLVMSDGSLIPLPLRKRVRILAEIDMRRKHLM